MRMCFLLFLIFNLAAGQPSSPEAKNERVRKCVEEYCRSAYEGDVNLDLLAFSKAALKREKENAPDMRPGVVLLDGDEFYIVGSYQILQVTFTGKKGSATVLYKRLARAKANELILDNKPQDTVHLRLIYKSNTWMIFDPPMARVSRRALIEYLDSLPKFAPDDPQRTEQARVYDAKIRTEIEALKKLLD